MVYSGSLDTLRVGYVKSEEFSTPVNDPPGDVLFQEHSDSTQIRLFTTGTKNLKEQRTLEVKTFNVRMKQKLFKK